MSGELPSGFSVLSTEGARVAEAEFGLPRHSLRRGETVSLLGGASVAEITRDVEETPEQKLGVEFIAD